MLSCISIDPSFTIKKIIIRYSRPNVILPILQIAESNQAPTKSHRVLLVGPTSLCSELHFIQHSVLHQYICLTLLHRGPGYPQAVHTPIMLGRCFNVGAVLHNWLYLKKDNVLLPVITQSAYVSEVVLPVIGKV